MCRSSRPSCRRKSKLPRRLAPDFENGEFNLEWGAVDRVDLDGDLYNDWVLNESGFACSTAASLFCGTGGCMSHFLVEDELHSLLNQGWDIVDLGPHRVLLADVHGSQCGGINPTPCATASTWDTEEKTLADDRRGVGVTGVTCPFSPPPTPELVRKAARP